MHTTPAPGPPPRPRTSPGAPPDTDADVAPDRDGLTAADRAVLARAGVRVYSRRGKATIAALLLVIAAAVTSMVVYARLTLTFWRPRTAGGQQAMYMHVKLASPVGSPEARVRVVVLMEHCLAPVQDLIVQIATAYPDQVRAEFHSVYAPEARAAATGSEYGSGCAGILINGHQHVQVEADGARREVKLHSNPGGLYSLDDVAGALRTAIRDAYGQAPADFSERIRIPSLSDYPSAAGLSAPSPESPVVETPPAAATP